MQRKAATIVHLWARKHQDHGLTMQDRIHALRWEETDAAGQGVRLAIHPREGDAPESSDFVSIYPRNQPFATFNAARNDGRISVWRSCSGRDVGRFATMGEALAAVSAETLKKQRRR